MGSKQRWFSMDVTVAGRVRHSPGYCTEGWSSARAYAAIDEAKANTSHPAARTDSSFTRILDAFYLTSPSREGDTSASLFTLPCQYTLPSREGDTSASLFTLPYQYTPWSNSM
ncbi:uncharacterized protein LOC123517142 [Portunus trituberculatus]|uniref:uncharacterized protein LOC123517142 n=1 Tax=Portunus trituberculatus TaxID=210409 RepID=UPI001E1CD6F9|nr:uncharacterized protein LOC123517142 [Portunus trituberculatus]